MELLWLCWWKEPSGREVGLLVGVEVGRVRGIATQPDNHGPGALWFVSACPHALQRNTSPLGSCLSCWALGMGWHLSWIILVSGVISETTPVPRLFSPSPQVTVHSLP